MGRKITQKIYTCSYCGDIPEDGATMWEMDSQKYICESCADEGVDSE